MIKRTLYFGNPAYLSIKNAQLVIKKPDDGDLPSDDELRNAIRTIPIEDIGVVILDNKQITITSAAISALLDNNVALITCNEKSMPTGLVLPLESHTLQTERFRYQLDSSLPLRKQLWQQTVQAKIRNQAAVLKYVTGNDARNMLIWAADVKSGDNGNLEARAAAFYWKNIFPNIADFSRDRYNPAPNNLLNYGYAILRAIIARSLVGSGLLPTMGIHHHNRYNAYCLADDIMEPYRPYVDILVSDIIKEHATPPELTRNIKAQLLNIPVLDVNIDGHRSPLMIAATTTTASLYKCFSGESRKILYPEL
ncbi:MAG: type II CRISPR-associated endonuclease Cas1 [Bacteroidales bacterium]|nr:type II CRISPR-associated endonuclease Cas1 [Bacteroidales bacterium]